MTPILGQPPREPPRAAMTGGETHEGKGDLAKPLAAPLAAEDRGSSSRYQQQRAPGKRFADVSITVHTESPPPPRLMLFYVESHDSFRIQKYGQGSKLEHRLYYYVTGRYGHTCRLKDITPRPNLIVTCDIIEVSTTPPNVYELRSEPVSFLLWGPIVSTNLLIHAWNQGLGDYGMSRVCGSECPWWQRAVWALALLVCTALTAVQIWDRLTYYLLVPVTVNVRVTRNQSLRVGGAQTAWSRALLLSVWLASWCPGNRFNMTAVRALQERRGNASARESWGIPDLVGTAGMSARDVWEFTSHDQSRMCPKNYKKRKAQDTIVAKCWFTRGRTCEEVGSWTTVYTVLGVCNQFTLREPVAISGIFNNMYLLLHDQESESYENDRGFKILIHDPRDDPVIDLRTHGTTLMEGWVKDVRVAVREFKTIPTNRRPCIATPTYSSSQCISMCFLRTLYDETKCLMPYMSASVAPTGEPCRTPEQYRLAIEKEQDLLFYGGWSHVKCNCLKQCNEDIYSTYTEAAKTSGKSAKLRVFFQDLTYDEVSEDIAYGAIALLCDIGGTLGLLLGASVLTFIEFVEVVGMKFLPQGPRLQMG
ncbi:acid-sensing ion channel 1-like [Penaeus monodon]|uniref:acid-sensing ion channel 1-like n=1 Tax=Penaeus monodon TaxID=6687 RepID=UPI0018A709DB|nr:acid-sensing ion channel 1-like [Penaeus monodon]